MSVTASPDTWSLRWYNQNYVSKTSGWGCIEYKGKDFENPLVR